VIVLRASAGALRLSLGGALECWSREGARGAATERRWKGRGGAEVCLLLWESA